MLVSIITLAVVLLDIVSKYLVVQLLLPLQREVVVIPHVLNFSYVENKGAAFGILADSRWLFMLASAVLLIGLILLIRFSKINHPLFLISTSMILGGGIGNMIDRIFVGYVVDFLKATFIDFPVFNVADCAVVIGTVLFAVYFIFFDKALTSEKTDGKQN